MDYEKEYKSLVAKIKIAHLNAQTDSTKNVLEDILPALRESEDERARKAALEGIEYLERKLGWDAIGDTDILDVKEYLEKQKVENHDGKKWIYEDEYHKDMERCFNDGKDEVLENPGKYGLQKEQKPAEKQDYSGLNDLERAILRGFLCAGVENVPVGIIKETAKDCITQMKPAEWSEDDKMAIDSAYVALRAYSNGVIPEFLPSELIGYADRLQSLRPSWKPSEGQKQALKRAIDCLDGEYCDHPEELDSLLNDLNKL